MAGVDPITLAVMAASTAVSEKARQNNIKASQRSYQNQIDLLNTRRDIVERSRKRELERLSAKQRARFAAQGLSSADGSSSAVIEGMTALSEEQARDRDRLAELERRKLTDGMSSLSDENLLTRKAPMLLDNMTRLLNWD